MDTEANVTMKVCKKCEVEKPLSEFYTHKHTKDGHLSACKVCQRKANSQYPPVPKEISGNPGEQIAVDKMRALGMFAMTGKLSRWVFQDVIVWGCVRIECKKSQPNAEGEYHFKFDSQARNDTNSHFILLMCDSGDEITYHLFPSYHPVFYRGGSKQGANVSASGRKYGVQYKPGRKHSRNTFGVSMNDALMAEYQDKWELIEQQRQLISQRLIAGTYIDDQIAA